MYKDISKLKNIHKGEDIWVVLGGSSMDYIDSDFFKNKIVVGQNQVYKHYPCKYVVMKDCMEEPRFPRSIRRLDSMGIPLIFPEYYKGYCSNQKNKPEHTNAYVFKHNPRTDDFDTELKNLKDDEIIVSKSSVTSLLHTTAYMGAKNIILCGHDCGTLDGNLYYDGYMEKDWISSENWSGIRMWMSGIEYESQSVRKYLKDKFNCNIHSLNPFLNLGLEGHKYEAC
tara:strand:+ start:488 stop:1165 length:678 start_codon:yes stop_codon:yes gene_type:complete